MMDLYLPLDMKHDYINYIRKISINFRFRNNKASLCQSHKN